MKSRKHLNLLQQATRKNINKYIKYLKKDVLRGSPWAQSPQGCPEGASLGSRGSPEAPILSFGAPFEDPIGVPKFEKRGPEAKRRSKNCKMKKPYFEAPLSHFRACVKSRAPLLPPSWDAQIQKKGSKNRLGSEIRRQRVFFDFERLVSMRAHF